MIVAEGLVKRYGETTALAGVDLAVRPGTVLGLLGPNGAGKTTAVRVLATLLRPDAGVAKVGGYDVAREASRVRELMASGKLPVAHPFQQVLNCSGNPSLRSG